MGLFLKLIFCLVEEELKRLNEEVGGSYGAVNFNYDNPAQPQEQEIQAAQQEGMRTDTQLVPLNNYLNTTDFLYNIDLSKK